MIKSMTGFGRCEVVGENGRFTVEIKSVNHRYLDMNIRTPKKMSFFENAVRGELKSCISRGKVDVYISYEDLSEHAGAVHYNRETAREYLTHLRRMAEDFGLADDVSVSVLSGYPEVVTREETGVDEEKLWKELKGALLKAAERFVESRVLEGRQLWEDLEEKLAGIRRRTDFIEERFPEVVSAYRRRLEEKVRELLGSAEIDENRILTEVTLFADRICVDEELVRLKSHIEAVDKALQEDIPVGRKLDFIVQEMNREANTILSKSGDLEITACAIELKTEIEKIREQIQNIE